MTNDRQIENATATSPIVDVDDYTLGISLDGDRQSVGWKVMDYGDNGALSDDQIEVLAKRFSLSRNQLRELSWDLGRALGQLPIAELISRSKAATEATSEINKAIKEVLLAERRLKAALSRLNRIYVDAYTEGHEKFTSANRQLANCCDLAGDIADLLKVAVDIPNLAFLLRHEKPQHIPDHRRNGILSTIMHFWHDLGRKLTSTTDDQTSERRGDLIDFVNAVVGCISDPPGSLGGETIIAAIKMAKRVVLLRASVIEHIKNSPKTT